MNKIELLAPAKNFEFGVAAINSGADAVYVGASYFGARKAASNNLEDIERLIKYAHFFDVSVYVTVNTLIFEKELNDVKTLIHELYKIGADAIIFQDFAILEMDLPPIKLFASTQTNNYNIEKIKYLDKLKIDRVILARELSLEQIYEIRKSTSIELETFIFGALCVSLSGQCYLSRYLGNRSANRGECAQPCRTIYSLIDASGKILIKDKHLLSIKDLNLENYLPQLLDCGVSSFKIEGRLKDIDYVTNVVSYFRKKIDNILIEKNLIKSSSGIILNTFTPDVFNTFNRGFTDYFIISDNNKIAAHNSPKFIGEKIGKVIKSSEGIIEIDTNKELTNGDGLCFFMDNILNGIRINKYENKKIYHNKQIVIKNGTIIYRNFNKNFIDVIIKNPPKRKVLANILIEEIDARMKFIITDEDNNMFSHVIDFPFEPALNKNKQIDVFKIQFKKTGNSNFVINDVIVKLNVIPHLKISELNSIKEILIEGLGKLRIFNYKTSNTSYKKSKINYFEKNLDYRSNIINPLSKQFFENRGVENFETGFELDPDKDNVNLMTTKYCLRYEIDQCLKRSETHYKGDLYLIGNNNKFKLEFDCKNCFMFIKKS